MKKKRHSAAWKRQKRRLIAKHNGTLGQTKSPVQAAIDVQLPRMEQPEVSVDGQTLETWLDDHIGEPSKRPEATSSEILEQNRQDVAMHEESKLQREASTRMRRGKQTGWRRSAATFRGTRHRSLQ